jgi:hypothetical protein
MRDLSDEPIGRAIYDAIDDLRQPSDHVLASAMPAVRSTPQNRRPPRLVLGFAAALAGVLAIALIGVMTFRNSQPQPAVTSPTCTLPVLSDFGSGLLSYPSLIFTPANVPAAQATAYDTFNHAWYATVPEGISPDGRLIALHDNLKGDEATMTLETATGQVLYARDYVFRILGWSQDGSLIFTTSDTDRLAMVSANGTNFRYIDPVGYGADVWRFARGNSVWGVTAGSVNDTQHRMFVVRLDLGSGAVTDWYGFVPGSFNDSGGGIILGLTGDGYPIVPELLNDAVAGVAVIRHPTVVTPIHLGGADHRSANFWPYHAFGDGGGVWLATYDGELYRSVDGGPLLVAQPKNGMHVYALAGRCE